jgi:pyruvate/2-oxoglutarate dehydrogenase complex dihydrolipoamide acyltransferase (E2) component
MTYTLRVPEALDGATLSTWMKKDGDRVAAGEPVAAFDLDGAATPLLSDKHGVVLRTLLRAGVRVGEGSPLAILGDEGEQLGWDPAQVRPVRMTILRRCDECGNEYPLNGLVERVRCTGCGDMQTARAAFWKDYVSENVREASAPGQLAGGNILAGKHGKATISCVGIPPLCRKCYTLIDWTSVANAWGPAQQGPTEVKCVGCGEPHQARIPPAWAPGIFPNVIFVLGETASASQQAPKPVVFKCPSCMAALEIDQAAKRISHCKFCDSDIYLPDDLWLHFNPASKRGRWWILLRP